MGHYPESLHNDFLLIYKNPITCCDYFNMSSPWLSSSPLIDLKDIVSDSNAAFLFYEMTEPVVRQEWTISKCLNHALDHKSFRVKFFPWFGQHYSRTCVLAAAWKEHIEEQFVMLDRHTPHQLNSPFTFYWDKKQNAFFHSHSFSFFLLSIGSMK